MNRARAADVAAPSDGAATRRKRIFAWADLRSVPLRTIVVTVAIVVVVYLAGQLLYRLRDVVLLVVIGSGYPR